MTLQDERVLKKKSRGLSIIYVSRNGFRALVLDEVTPW